MNLVPCEPKKYFHGGSHAGWAILSWGFSAYRLINHGWLIVPALEDFAIKLIFQEPGHFWSQGTLHCWTRVWSSAPIGKALATSL